MTWDQARRSLYAPPHPVRPCRLRLHCVILTRLCQYHRPTGARPASLPRIGSLETLSSHRAAQRGPPFHPPPPRTANNSSRPRLELSVGSSFLDDVHPRSPSRPPSRRPRSLASTRPPRTDVRRGPESELCATRPECSALLLRLRRFAVELAGQLGTEPLSPKRVTVEISAPIIRFKRAKLLRSARGESPLE